MPGRLLTFYTNGGRPDRQATPAANVLVATGAALYVQLSAYGFPAAPGGAAPDPTRVTAQIVSGIGFLGAGVILRDGLNVRGLNTAASLWCSAAVGSLAGAGMYAVATGAAADLRIESASTGRSSPVTSLCVRSPLVRNR